MKRYLGPKWLPKWDFPYWREFNKAAIKHDNAYSLKLDRKEADYNFLINCLKEANKYNGKKRKLMKLFALLYYILVRLFGWISFYIDF